MENELDGRAVPAALRLIKKQKTPTLPWNRIIGHTLCEGGKNYVNLIELFQGKVVGIKDKSARDDLER